MIFACVEIGPCHSTGEKTIQHILYAGQYFSRLVWYFRKFDFFFRCVNEGGPAHAKRFTFAVRVNTTDKGWTDECVGEPMPSVKKAKDSAAVLLLDLLNKLYS